MSTHPVNRPNPVHGETYLRITFGYAHDVKNQYAEDKRPLTPLMRYIRERLRDMQGVTL